MKGIKKIKKIKYQNMSAWVVPTSFRSLPLLLWGVAFFAPEHTFGAKAYELSSAPRFTYGTLHKTNFRQPKPKRHTVAAKETLFFISQKYGVTIADLKLWNNLTDNAILVGQELIVSGDIKAPEELYNTAKDIHASGKVTHLVAQKETLYSLSKLYNVTVQQIIAWNNIGPQGLLAGSTIWVGEPTQAGPPPPIVVSAPVDNTPLARPAVPPVKVVKPVETPNITMSKPAATAPVVASDGTNTERVEEGMMQEIENGDKNKYFALHRTAAIGSILRVVNMENGKDVFVRVNGKLPDSEGKDIVIRITNLAASRLGVTNFPAKVQVVYYQ